MFATSYVFTVTGDLELEVGTATYGPEIDQPQHTKSVGHIINHYMNMLLQDLQCIYFHTQQNQYNAQPILEQIKYGVQLQRNL